eukprot:TRINITY_DN2405_c0_g1_i1.p1 TRINITY_DN2405_c0_g1~~TRINITY_DN2405_c0_g1_i1.p1  ORF type:complete len:161 (-),score=21.20 TRINITY_DN2405_c0_g1_i1:103-585(-)
MAQESERREVGKVKICWMQFPADSVCYYFLARDFLVNSNVLVAALRGSIVAMNTTLLLQFLFYFILAVTVWLRWGLWALVGYIWVRAYYSVLLLISGTLLIWDFFPEIDDYYKLVTGIIVVGYSLWCLADKADFYKAVGVVKAQAVSNRHDEFMQRDTSV